ncbi:hypothetical protein D7Z54_07055 [Salibacterium salarium]|uniref:Uncharacterized protein n=1 Tax=Salibacterium salarium TaxID=284579 RepID=A0A428N7G0_9BACI|nr:CBO0543 family protein [Salibacterium salarium]RSL34304.1 hypothetical protein D7Z54_07055 [Salibacterium salarium]
MKDKTVLNITTIIGVGGMTLLFRKGPIKEWILVYLLKTLVCTFLDVPVVQKKLVRYPKRYFAKSFDSNIVYIYIIFPLLCVAYNQFTFQKNLLKTIPNVFFFSGPMAIVENWLEKNTRLIQYGNGWNSYYTLAYLTFSFWLVRTLMICIHWIDKKRYSFLS